MNAILGTQHLLVFYLHPYVSFSVLCRRQGIPEKERWECRKNALSEEMRRYLATGTLPNETPNNNITPKSEEGRPAVQAVPLDREENGSHSSKAKSVSPNGREELVKTRDSGKDSGSSASAAHNAESPPDATISIASLFGWGHDREEDEDY